MGISAAALAMMRATVAGFFDLTSSVLTRTVVPNAAGSQTVSYVVSAVAVPTHVRSKRREPIESEQTGAISALKRFDVILQQGTPISVTSRIAVNSGSSTTVAAVANSATQTVVSTVGFVPGCYCYFATARVFVQVLSVPSLTSLVLASAVDSTEGETVTAAALYEVLGEDSGKSYETKIICDCVRVNDGII